MTETDWLSCSDPVLLLRHVSSTASERKLRLLACATCRRLWFMLREEHSRRAVEVAERFADDLASADELAAVFASADRAALEAERAHVTGWNAARTAAASAGRSAVQAAERAVTTGADAELVREVFGNPFRAVVVPPAWLAWDGGALPRIARDVYDERRFRDVSVLGDALEEAGCTDQAMLEHCWSGQRHYRGCWVIDLLLGR
jgi:hypothetical protein